MRSVLPALALLIALAPTVEALASGPLHSGCDSASSDAVHVSDEDPHSAHRAATDTPATWPDPRNQCDCGCECGPGHGCTAASAAAPSTSGTILLIADALAPSTPFHPVAIRVDAPLYRPPITQLTF